MKIAILGSTGMAGHMVAAYMDNKDFRFTEYLEVKRTRRDLVELM